MTSDLKAASNEKPKFNRVPGLFERWEIGFMVDDNVEFYVEQSGTTDEDDPLFALYEAEQEYICDDCREEELTAVGPVDHSSTPTR